VGYHWWIIRIILFTLLLNKCLWIYDFLQKEIQFCCCGFSAETAMSLWALLTCGPWATVCGSRSFILSTNIGHGVLVDQRFSSGRSAVPDSVSQVTSSGKSRGSPEQTMDCQRKLGTYASCPTADSRYSQEGRGSWRGEPDRSSAQEGCKPLTALGVDKRWVSG